MHIFRTDTWRVDDQMGSHHLSCKTDVQNDDMAEEENVYKNQKPEHRQTAEAWMLCYMTETNTHKRNSGYFYKEMRY